MAQAKITSYYNTRKTNQVKINGDDIQVKNKEIGTLNVKIDVKEKNNTSTVKKISLKPIKSKTRNKTNQISNPVEISSVPTVKNDRNKKGKIIKVSDKPKKQNINNEKLSQAADNSKKQNINNEKIIQVSDNPKKQNVNKEKIIEIIDVPTSIKDHFDLKSVPEKVETKDNANIEHQNDEKDNNSKVDSLLSKMSPKRKLQILEESCPSPTKIKHVTSLNNVFANKEQLSELKTKLFSNPSFGELKEKLKIFEQKTSKLKEFHSNKHKIISIVASEKVDQKDTNVANKEDVSILPAYEKFNRLVVPGTPSLTLPFKYNLLSEIFHSLDVVVSMMHNRGDAVTFEKVKQSVQSMTNKSFTKTHLGQILTVYPEAYNVHLSSNLSSEGNLVIVPKLDKNGSNNSTSASPRKQISKSSQINQFTPINLSERKKIFNAKLLNVVKKHHQEFLSKLNPPLVIPDEKINRWHPKFPIDLLPDIETANLPKLREKCTRAESILKKNRKLGGRVEKALLDVAKKASLAEDKKNETLTASSKAKNEILKQISADLLAKIRDRESVKFSEMMMQSPLETEKNKMKKNIPEIIKVLRNYFIAERKIAVPVDKAIAKVLECCHFVQTDIDVKKHFELITEVLPGWLIFINISKGMFLKMDKNKDIKALESLAII